MRRDYTAIVESVYQLESDEASWLDGVARAMRPAFDQGLGFWAMLYDATTRGRARVHRFVHEGIAPGVVSGTVARLLTEDVWPSPTPTCGLVSELEARVAGGAMEHIRAFGVDDVLGVHAANPCEGGVYFGASLPRGARVTNATRQHWAKVAAHLAAAYRLRKRLAADPSGTPVRGGIEAVLAPDGRVLDARAGASSPASLRALRDAALAIDRARGRLRRTPDLALSQWKGLVAAKWTLLDQFDRDGRRFIVARTNDPVTPPIDVLTERERQVAAFACLGHSNKLIAYELGLATSTVGVLLSRAMKKLGVHGRKALIAAVNASR